MKIILFLGLVLADNHDSDPFVGPSCIELLADDGAPLCSKAGQEEAADFTDDMEDELAILEDEMKEYFEINLDYPGTDIKYISNAKCEQWQDDLEYLKLSTYYQESLDFYCKGYNYENQYGLDKQF